MPGRRNASLQRLNRTPSRLAMNKPSVIASHYAANAQVASQLLPSRMWGRDPGIVDYTHDIALARSRLTHAGYGNGCSTSLAVRDAATG